MNQPLVFAHRGSSHALPEHTLPAYLRAIQEGADGLECDVRLTQDGHLVCVHDRRIDRRINVIWSRRRYRSANRSGNDRSVLDITDRPDRHDCFNCG